MNRQQYEEFMQQYQEAVEEAGGDRDKAFKIFEERVRAEGAANTEEYRKLLYAGKFKEAEAKLFEIQGGAVPDSTIAVQVQLDAHIVRYHKLCGVVGVILAAVSDEKFREEVREELTQMTRSTFTELKELPGDIGEGAREMLETLDEREKEKKGEDNATVQEETPQG